MEPRAVSIANDLLSKIDQLSIKVKNLEHDLRINSEYLTVVHDVMQKDIKQFKFDLLNKILHLEAEFLRFKDKS